MTSALNIIILAAGQGTRMRSALPKVLHKIGHLTLLERVVRTAKSLSPQHIYVVCGHQSERLRTECAHLEIQWIEQSQQLGTGHAVQQALPLLQNPEDKVLILYGDVPLITKNTLTHLLAITDENTLGILTAKLDNPFGFGRIIRNNNNQVIEIIEEKDASSAQKQIHEINTGVYATTVKQLQQWLPKLSNNNQQKEFYLTDIVKLAVQDNIKIATYIAHSNEEIQGVNDRAQLAQLERYFQYQLAKQYMLSGVTLRDPHRIDIRGNADISEDVTIDVNVILEGNVTIGSNSTIGANCVLRNVQIGDHVTIKDNCVLEDAIIHDHCAVGPFARIRPGTVLAEKVHVGNFVEIKKSTIGTGSKIPHLSYVGDATLGNHVNFGAGAITCNYDGITKKPTTIGNNVFIGSDSQLIAPVTIEDGAYIGAGSTISKNAPANKLTLSRSKQQTIENWQRPIKEKKED